MARVLISMPEEFLNKIDQVADGENRSRSELIREALRTYIYKQKVRESTTAARNAEVSLTAHLFADNGYANLEKVRNLKEGEQNPFIMKILLHFVPIH